MRPSTSRFGFQVALAACIASVSFSVIQILQVVDLVPKPLDEILIYGTSLAIATPYVLAMLALHHAAADDRKLWTHAALVFGVMYAIFVSFNYVVQLATVVPARVAGTVDEIRVLDQTPHSMFWDVDALGYIFLGVSTLFAGFAFDASERWLRRFMFANALITPLIALVYFYPRFSIALLLLGTPWLVTVPGALLLLALHFRRAATSAVAQADVVWTAPALAAAQRTSSSSRTPSNSVTFTGLVR